jgi:hypothetical protein
MNMDSIQVQSKFLDFLKRLERHLPLLERLGVAYRPAFPPPPDNPSKP